MTKIGVLSIVVVSLLLGGCAGSKPRLQIDADFAPVRPVEQEVVGLPTGSIMGNNGYMSLFQGQRMWRVGDIVTIVLSESTQATRNASMITEREAKNTVLNDRWVKVFTPDGGALRDVLPGVDVTQGTIESEGTGAAAQANALTGVISAMVVEVLPNQNLIVEGQKQVSLTEGAEYIQVRGVVRARDVQPDNTISSMRLAQAQISYRGNGNIATSTQPGWVTQLLYKFWPL